MLETEQTVEEHGESHKLLPLEKQLQITDESRDESASTLISPTKIPSDASKPSKLVLLRRISRQDLRSEYKLTSSQEISDQSSSSRGSSTTQLVNRRRRNLLRRNRARARESSDRDTIICNRFDTSHEIMSFLYLNNDSESVVSGLSSDDDDLSCCNDDSICD